MGIAPISDGFSPPCNSDGQGRMGKDKYRIIGPVYDFLSALYSGRQIHNTKIAMNTELKPGQKVLFAGVGHGRDAVDAAARGARVTVVDLSATMLKKVEKNISGKGFDHPIRLVHSNILEFDAPGQYDQVVANFFLNVFKEQPMQRVLGHMAGLVKPQGNLVVGDFSYPSGGLLTRTVQNLYWYIAVILFTVFAKNAVHRIYNYPKHLEALGFSISKIRTFRILSLPMYWSIQAVKPNVSASSKQEDL